MKKLLVSILLGFVCATAYGKAYQQARKGHSGLTPGQRKDSIWLGSENPAVWD
jgi:hypothetical protein